MIFLMGLLLVISLACMLAWVMGLVLLLLVVVLVLVDGLVLLTDEIADKVWKRQSGGCLFLCLILMILLRSVLSVAPKIIYACFLCDTLHLCSLNLLSGGLSTNEFRSLENVLLHTVLVLSISISKIEYNSLAEYACLHLKPFLFLKSQ